MAIAFRATDSTDHGNSSATITVNKPAGVVDDDHMFVQIVSSSSSSSMSTVPTGWTLLHSGANIDYHKWIYHKVAASEGASWDWVANSATYFHSGIIVLSGTDGTAVDATVQEESSSSTAAVTITTTNADSWLVAFTGSDVSGAARNWSADGGMTEAFDDSTATERLICAGYYQSVTTVTNYTRTFTLTGNAQQLHGFMVAAQPSAVAAGGIVVRNRTSTKHALTR